MRAIRLPDLTALCEDEHHDECPGICTGTAWAPQVYPPRPTSGPCSCACHANPDDRWSLTWEVAA